MKFLKLRQAILLIFSFLFMLHNEVSGQRCVNPCTRYNEVQQISSHNSYDHDDYKPDIYMQANLGVRSFEFDLHNKGALWTDADPNEWDVYHIGGGSGDYCGHIADCLLTLREWHNTHPQHEVITVWLQMNDGWGSDGHQPVNLDNVLDQLFRGLIYKPQDILNACPGSQNLQDAIIKCGWPTLERLTGKFIFVIMGNNTACIDYLDDVKEYRDFSNGNGNYHGNKNCFVAPENLHCTYFNATIQATSKRMISLRNAIFWNFGIIETANAFCISQKGLVTRMYGDTDLPSDGDASIHLQSEYSLAVSNKTHHIATNRATQQFFHPRLIDDCGNLFRLIVDPQGNRHQTIISRFEPATAKEGDIVSIYGKGFKPPCQNVDPLVSIGGNLVTVISASNELIRVLISETSCSGNIWVGSENGSITANQQIIIEHPIALTGFEPTKGRIGDIVTIYGRGFISPEQPSKKPIVIIGSLGINEPPEVLFADYNQIKIRIGEQTGSGNVAVVSTNGAAAASSKFTLLKAPSITDFSPKIASAGDTVTIKGQNLEYNTTNELDATITIGTIFIPIVSASSNELKIRIQSTTPIGSIKVTTPGGSIFSRSIFKRYIQIRDIYPASGKVGDQIEIRGTGFTKYNIRRITVGTIELNSHDFTIYDSLIRFRVTERIQTGLVAIETNQSRSISGEVFGGMTVTSSNVFTMISNTIPPKGNTGNISVPTANLTAPIITGFNPRQANIYGTITINGSGFTGVSAVKFYNQPVEFNIINDNTITVSVTDKVLSGYLQIFKSPNWVPFSAYPFTNLQMSTPTPPKNNNPIGIKQGIDDNKTIVNPNNGKQIIVATPFIKKVPVIYSFSPETGAAGTEITIKGENFDNQVQVYIGTQDVKPYMVTATSLKIKTDVNTPNGVIKITTSAGTVTSVKEFKKTTVVKPSTVIKQSTKGAN